MGDPAGPVVGPGASYLALVDDRCRRPLDRQWRVAGDSRVRGLPGRRRVAARWAACCRLVRSRRADVARVVWPALSAFGTPHAQQHIPAIDVDRRIASTVIGTDRHHVVALRASRAVGFKPGGTTMSTLFWASAIAGLAIGPRRLLSIVLAAVPLSAFALAAVVPLHQRFSIWIVPALYAGVALLVDRGDAVGRAACARRRWQLAVSTPLILIFQAHWSPNSRRAEKRTSTPSATALSSTRSMTGQPSHG